MEQYSNPAVTEDMLYLIDKVVRLRGKDGRFGVDHSEILNYELELANKARDQHMNHLVYKNENPYTDVSEGIQMPGEMSTSNILFKRLSNKGPISTGSKLTLLESEGAKASRRSVHTNKDAPDFQQWVRKKDAEKRLKKKLINELKREMRQELLEYAKQEKETHDSRATQMDAWLTAKKLDEAYKMTQLRGDS
jgi:hypothetical protein